MRRLSMLVLALGMGCRAAEPRRLPSWSWETAPVPSAEQQFVVGPALPPEQVGGYVAFGERSGWRVRSIEPVPGVPRRHVVTLERPVRP
jgi:hypothetical protein